MKKFNVVAWDSGTSFDKFVIGEGDENKLKFPSNTYEVDNKDEFGLNTSNLSVNNLHIKFEEVMYYVGQKAIEQDPKGGQRNFRTESFKEPSQIAKFLVGMAYLAKEQHIEIDLLMLDLNMREYKSNHQQFAQIYKNRTFSFEVSDKEYKIIVKDVVVNPQGIIAAYSNDLNWEGQILNETNRRKAVIDIGGRTSDGALFNGLDIIDGTYFSTEEGMTDAFKRVGNNLEVPWQLVEYSYINNEDLYYGSRKEYGELCNREFKKLARRIYNDATAQWSKQLMRISEVDMVGGGGKSTIEFFNNFFDNKTVQLIEDAQFANANGNYKLGKLLKRKAEAV